MLKVDWEGMLWGNKLKEEIKGGNKKGWVWEGAWLEKMHQVRLWIFCSMFLPPNLSHAHIYTHLLKGAGPGLRPWICQIYYSIVYGSSKARYIFMFHVIYRQLPLTSVSLCAMWYVVDFHQRARGFQPPPWSIHEFFSHIYHGALTRLFICNLPSTFIISLVLILQPPQ